MIIKSSNTKDWTVKDWTITLNHMDGYVSEEDFKVYQDIINTIGGRGFNIKLFNENVRENPVLKLMLKNSLTNKWTAANSKYFPQELLLEAKKSVRSR